MTEKDMFKKLKNISDIKDEIIDELLAVNKDLLQSLLECRMKCVDLQDEILELREKLYNEETE